MVYGYKGSPPVHFFGIDDFRMKGFLNWKNLQDMGLNSFFATYGTKIWIRGKAVYVKHCMGLAQVRAPPPGPPSITWFPWGSKVPPR